MALEQVTVIDRKEVLENGVIQIRESQRIMEGAKIIAQKYNRYVLHPNDNVSSKPQEIQDLCSLVWTDDVILSYEESQKIVMNKK